MKSDLTTKIPLKKQIENILYMTGYIKKMERWYFVTVFFFHFFGVVTGYLSLILSATVLNMIVQKDSAEKIILTVAGFLAAYYVLQMLTGFFAHQNEIKKESIGRKYEFMVTKKMMDMDYSLVESPRVQEIRKRMETDNQWGSGIYEYFWHVDGVFEMPLSIFFGLVLLIPMFSEVSLTNVSVGMILFVMLMTAVFFILKYQKKKEAQFETRLFNPLFDTEKEMADKCSLVWTMVLEENYNYKNGKDVRIYDGYDLFDEYLYQKMEKYERRELDKTGKLEAIQGSIKEGVFHFLFGSGYFLVGFLVLGTKVAAGNLVQYAGALQQILNSIVRFIYIFGSLSLGARKQMSTLELFELKDEMYQGKLPIEKRSDDAYEIEFEHVSFRYPGAKEYALKDLSIKFRIGEKMAIVGRNGSGKTTMIKLLCRLYEPTEGRILLNGVDIRKFQEQEYRRLFSVVFQDFKLFDLELGENVAGSETYDKEKAEYCLKKAGFSLNQKKMTKGMDTYLYKGYDESGVEISGGEAQKIAIARALYKQSSFILLDEPTAALDPLAENEIYQSFDAIVGTKTAIYISHRLSSCKFCNDIIVFDQGKLIQRGSHEQLLKDTGGRYYEMWNAQAQYYQ